MLDLYAELRRVVEALERAAVRYALVGGLAVSIYTRPRATEDIDLLLETNDVSRAMMALEPLGFRPAGQPMQVAAGRIHIQRLLMIDGTDLLPLDLLTSSDREITALFTDRTAITLEGQPLWIAGLGALRALKRLRGSAQDRADLEALGPES